MATENSTHHLLANNQEELNQVFASRIGRIKPPSAGCLKWIGGNLALDHPVQEEALDSNGNILFMNLAQVLRHLDEFEGVWSGTGATIQDAIIHRCISARQSGFLTDEEQSVLQSFVRQNPVRVFRATCLEGPVQ